MDSIFFVNKCNYK